ncbi:MAG: hypothetical protein ACKO7R_00725 [Pseudanabaena sp.]
MENYWRSQGLSFDERSGHNTSLERTILKHISWQQELSSRSIKLS